MLMLHADSELFDRGQFQAELALKSSPIAAFKKAIRQANTVLNERFGPECDIRALIHSRAWFIDQILQHAWARFDWGYEGHIALIAVGGYGRGELHPFSDIDILILLDGERQEEYRERIERFLTLLWDIGLQVGQSVRSVEECAHEARADLTVITNLMESRTIAGPDILRQRMVKVTAPEKMWSAHEFFSAKREEQRTRHARYNDTEYNLEPNVKGSPGGLRDVQNILWVACRLYGTLELDTLANSGLLSEHELDLLKSAQNFLWKVRYALHQVAARAEDRLLFEHQRKLAGLLGFEASTVKLAVERFMQKYYRVVMLIAELSDLVNQSIEESLDSAESSTLVPLNARFQIRNGFIEVTQPNVFRRTPSALLEIFVLLAEHPDIRGVRAATIRLLRDSRHLINDKYRHDLRNTSLFVELFHQPQGIHRNLKRMNRYGILGSYLPEFGHIVGQMQHDLFHTYTVDAHTLNLIKHLRKMMNAPEFAEKFPLASELMHKLPKPELVYFAGLYHDIAKGRGGDHSELGAEDALTFCARHHLPPWDSRLISWLVRSHLLMSTTAQRKDLSDPQVIHDFARAVGDQTHLDYLYVLTVADINATNSSLWNSWRASLLRQLYMETRRALRRGLENPVDREELICERQHAALDLLRANNKVDSDAVEQLWTRLGDDYFLRYPAADIAWHAEAILQHPQHGTPLVLLRETTQREFEGGTRIFIYAPDQHDFFAVTVAAMDQLNLSIQDAGILTSRSQFTLDTYVVLDADGTSIGNNPQRIEEVRRGLIEALQHPEQYSAIIQRRVPRQLKSFAFAPTVTIHTDSHRPLSIIEVIAPDRPGLLARIGQIFLNFDLSVQNAKIVTLGERVEDVFFVTNAQQQPLSDPELCAQLQAALVEQLADNSRSATPSRITF